MSNFPSFVKRDEVGFLIRHPGTACSVVRNHKDELLLVSVQRLGKAATLEIPGGRVEVNEATETAAARELLEETGIKSKSSRKMWAFTTAVGLTDELVTIYEHKTWAETEFQSEHEVTWLGKEEFWCHVQSGKILDCKTLVAGLTIWRSGELVDEN